MAYEFFGYRTPTGAELDGNDEAPWNPIPRDAKDVLNELIQKIPDHSPTLDLLLEALQHYDKVEAKAVELTNVSDYLAFVKGKPESQRMFLLVHPEQQGKRYASLATHRDDDGPIGWTYTWLSHRPGVNFTLIHGFGTNDLGLYELCKRKHLEVTGSMRALDVYVGDEPIPAHLLRPDGRITDSTILAMLPIDNVQHTKTPSGYRGRETIVQADWPRGWRVYGLTNVSCQMRASIRSFEDEQRPMTPDEMRYWLNAYGTFKSQCLREIDDLSAPHLYPNIRAWEKAERVHQLQKNILQYNGLAAQLNRSLGNPELPISHQDIRVEIWV